MSAISVNTGTGSPISITGLASGIETSAIIKALVAAERVPITQLTTQQEKLQAQQEELRSLQSALQQLSFSVAEFGLPSLFETSQKVTSSEPQRVAAVVTSGAGIGGYQVEVTQLANSAQRTFTFVSPASEETISIDGHEYKLAAGATAKELASEVNSDGTGTVYAAVLNSETIVFSTRATGATGGEFINVTAGALTEKAGTAKEGKDAEYSVDGVSGKSASNTLTEAIPGVTLTLGGVTTTAGPVTVDVQAPGPSTAAIEAQVQSFVKLYNTTVETLEKQITTKPIQGASNAKEYGVGTMFGDTELMGLLSRMRSSMYEAVAGLPATMSSPFDIGLGTGLAAGASSASPSQSSIEGQISLEPAKLASAIAESPEAVEKMLQGWSKNLQATINGAAQAGGGLASRIEGDESQITTLRTRISTMNEMLSERQKALVQTYAQLEAALAKNNAQLSWLGQQTELLQKG
ncbi:MAG: flagellar filament capping protein FliD [Solirubrobacteraceae bacterium]